jgi:hypothetical protein
MLRLVLLVVLLLQLLVLVLLRYVRRCPCRHHPRLFRRW